MSGAGRIKELFRKYGKTAVAVHFTVYFATLGGFYLAAESKLDVEGIFVRHGLLTERPAQGEHDDRQGWLSRTLAGRGSSLAIAFLCTKALMPLRAGVTFTTTPVVHRFVTRLRGQRLERAASDAQRQHNQ